MFTSNINITLPTTEQILWAYQACASPSFTSFTVEEKTAVMDMFLNVLQVLQARFANDAATISTEAASRRERILAKIEEAKLEYATLKSMLAMGFKEDFSQSKNGGAIPPSDSRKHMYGTIAASPPSATTEKKNKVVKRKRIIKKRGAIKKSKGPVDQIGV